MNAINPSMQSLPDQRWDSLCSIPAYGYLSLSPMIPPFVKYRPTARQTMLMGASLLALSTAAHAVDTSAKQGVFVSHREAPNNRVWNAPETNESPERWLIIDGHKDPSQEIWFQTTYATANTGCSTHSLSSLIGGAPAEPQRIDESIRVAAGTTNFIVRIPLDRFQAGKCDWRAFAVDVSSFLPSLTSGPFGGGTFAFVTANGPRDIQVNEQCKLVRSDWYNGIFPFCDPVTFGRVEVSEAGGHIDATFVITPAASNNP